MRDTKSTATKEVKQESNNNQNSKLQAAIELADLGYKIFPLRSCLLPEDSQGEPSKRPLAAGWQASATNSLTQVFSWWENNPNSNIGVLCGDIVVIDCDTKGSGFHGFLHELTSEQREAIEQAPAVGTPSGGIHRYFRTPSGLVIPSKNGVLHPHVDIKCRGGYVVGPGSDIRGRAYRWANGLAYMADLPELPECLVSMLRGKGFFGADGQKITSKNNTKQAEIPRADKYERASKYLAAMPESVSGNGGHDRAFAAARSLVHGFCLDPDDAMSLMLTEFNGRCQPPWSERELQHKIDDALSKPCDRELGWLLHAEKENRKSPAKTLLVDLSSPLHEKTESEVSEGEASEAEDEPLETLPEAPEWSDSALNPGGVLGELMTWMDKRAYKQSEPVWLGASIGLWSAICAKRFELPDGTRTNLYIVCLAGSGEGKNTAAQDPYFALRAAGLDGLVGPGDLTSGNALEKWLRRDHHDATNCLCCIDEFHKLFASMGDGRVVGGFAHLSKVLLKLYSASNSNYEFQVGVTTEDYQPIHEPCVSIVGAAITSNFFQSLGAASRIDGLVARMLVIDTPGKRKRRKVKDKRLKPPEHLIKLFQSIRECNQDGKTRLPRVATIQLSPEADAAIEAYAAKIDRTTDSLDESQEQEAATWNRALEKLGKLALLHALSLEPSPHCVVGQSSVSWAAEIVDTATLRTLRVIHERVGEDAFEAKCKRLAGIVRATGEAGISQRDLRRRFGPIKQRDWVDLVQAAKSSGTIKECLRPAGPAGGRPSSYFVAAQ